MPEAKDDKAWMHLAIEQAILGVGTCSPNPPVGAVIVKDDQLIGAGWHRQAGKPHAEREAIADATGKHGTEILKGATIYITLEPCSTQGQTPPCTAGIIAAGISRVVYGSTDPNPNHKGAAEEILQSANIEVTAGICKHECNQLIRAFTKTQTTGQPWVILKSAISLDGHITRPPGETQWLSSPESREFVQQLRYDVDAIITGGNTARRDNPSLTIRSKSLPTKTQPWRMLVTRGKKENLPSDLNLFTDPYKDRTLVQEDGDLRKALKRLTKRGCNSVMVEAGGNLMASFLEQQLVDELVIFYTPILTGGPDLGFGELTPKVELAEQQFNQIGNDVMLRAVVQRHKKTSDSQTVSP
ncbi:MAG: bifunctional diaminohydroxyphosphoribosylaminopyrimidine deaminase/5-amino-6-(5-phosphoribosylamino)uracil reductase RibD [Akkermansiaceae bacterium]